MNRIKRLVYEYVLKATPLVWVMIGFGFTYLLFFIRPLFFSAPVMPFFKYLPAANPIGLDIKNTLQTAQELFRSGQNPYINNSQYAYPPLTSLLVTPLLLFSPSTAYVLISLATIFCFGMSTLALPLLIGQGRRIQPVLILVFVTGLFSYGLQFELERGQFNLIAVALALMAAWVYQYHHKYRFFAYILFCISVQLKVYPLIFILLLIDDWHDWKNNLRRISALVAVNLAVCMVFGAGLFLDFIRAIFSQSVNPGIWTGNHSIHGFVTLIAGIAALQGRAWMERFTWVAQVILLVCIVLLICLVLLNTYRHNVRGMDPFLLMACSLGALLIPGASHDYTLSFLAAPVAVFLCDRDIWESAVNARRQLFRIEVLCLFSMAYASTLFSYAYKPIQVNNNFPALLLMLVLVALMSLEFGSKVVKTDFETPGAKTTT